MGSDGSPWPPARLACWTVVPVLRAPMAVDTQRPPRGRAVAGDVKGQNESFTLTYVTVVTPITHC